MTGIVERLGSMAGTEAGKAVNLAHETFSARMGVHNHFGRALLETVVEVAREHPNLMGIGAGLLVEQLLVEERHRHEAHVAAVAAGTAKPGQGLHLPHVSAPHLPDVHLPEVHLPHLPNTSLRLTQIRPGRVAMEVFGALLLLKLANAGAKLFRRKHQGEVWFAPAARIHLFSGTLAALYLAKSLRSPKVSAWRNAAVALFATDALKPVLKAPKAAKGARAAPVAAVGAAASEPSLSPPGGPSPPPSGQPVQSAPATPEAAPQPVEVETPPANDPVAQAKTSAAAAPQFWTPPARPDPVAPKSEILQWTNFTGGSAPH